MYPLSSFGKAKVLHTCESTGGPIRAWLCSIRLSIACLDRIQGESVSRKRVPLVLKRAITRIRGDKGKRKKGQIGSGPPKKKDRTPEPVKTLGKKAGSNLGGEGVHTNTRLCIGIGERYIKSNMSQLGKVEGVTVRQRQGSSGAMAALRAVGKKKSVPRKKQWSAGPALSAEY